MEMVTVREIVRNKEKTMEEGNSTIVSNNRGVACGCGCLRAEVTERLWAAL